RDPVGPDFSDEALEHVRVLATQIPMRAVECHGVDPADTSFVVIEGRVGVLRVAATENQDHLTRGLSDIALHRPAEDHERVAEPAPCWPAGSRNHAFRIVVCHDPTRTCNCSMASLRIASSLTLTLVRLPPSSELIDRGRPGAPLRSGTGGRVGTGVGSA